MFPFIYFLERLPSAVLDRLPGAVLDRLPATVLGPLPATAVDPLTDGLVVGLPTILLDEPISTMPTSAAFKIAVMNYRNFLSTLAALRHQITFEPIAASLPFNITDLKPSPATVELIPFLLLILPPIVAFFAILLERKAIDKPDLKDSGKPSGEEVLEVETAVLSLEEKKEAVEADIDILIQAHGLQVEKTLALKEFHEAQCALMKTMRQAMEQDYEERKVTLDQVSHVVDKVSALEMNMQRQQLQDGISTKEFIKQQIIDALDKPLQIFSSQIQKVNDREEAVRKREMGLAAQEKEAEERRIQRHNEFFELQFEFMKVEKKELTHWEAGLDTRAEIQGLLDGLLHKPVYVDASTQSESPAQVDAFSQSESPTQSEPLTATSSTKTHSTSSVSTQTGSPTRAYSTKSASTQTDSPAQTAIDCSSTPQDLIDSSHQTVSHGSYTPFKSTANNAFLHVESTFTPDMRRSRCNSLPLRFDERQKELNNIPKEHRRAASNVSPSCEQDSDVEQSIDGVEQSVENVKPPIAETEQPVPETVQQVAEINQAFEGDSQQAKVVEPPKDVLTSNGEPMQAATEAATETALETATETAEAEIEGNDDGPIKKSSSTVRNMRRRRAHREKAKMWKNAAADADQSNDNEGIILRDAKLARVIESFLKSTGYVEHKKNKGSCSDPSKEIPGSDSGVSWSKFGSSAEMIPDRLSKDEFNKTRKEYNINKGRASLLSSSIINMIVQKEIHRRQSASTNCDHKEENLTINETLLESFTWSTAEMIKLDWFPKLRDRISIFEIEQDRRNAEEAAERNEAYYSKQDITDDPSEGGSIVVHLVSHGEASGSTVEVLENSQSATKTTPQTLEAAAAAYDTEFPPLSTSITTLSTETPSSSVQPAIDSFVKSDVPIPNEEVHPARTDVQVPLAASSSNSVGPNFSSTGRDIFDAEPGVLTFPAASPSSSNQLTAPLPHQSVTPKPTVSSPSGPTASLFAKPQLQLPNSKPETKEPKSADLMASIFATPQPPLVSGVPKSARPSGQGGSNGNGRPFSPAVKPQQPNVTTGYSGQGLIPTGPRAMVEGGHTNGSTTIRGRGGNQYSGNSSRMDLQLTGGSGSQQQGSGNFGSWPTQNPRQSTQGPRQQTRNPRQSKTTCKHWAKGRCRDSEWDCLFFHGWT